MDNIDCHPLLIFQENDNDGQASIPLYSEFLNDNLFENIFFNDDNLIDMTSYQASFPSIRNFLMIICSKISPLITILSI